MRILDISLPLHEDMVVWPGDAPFRRTLSRQIARGDGYNLSRIETGAHAGTHVDAPRHFLEAGATIDQMDLTACLGPCRVVAVENRPAIARADLEPLDLLGVERLLIKTSNSMFYDQNVFVENYAGLTPDAADYLAGLESLRLIGLDYYSVGPFDETQTVAVHRVLLGRKIMLLEGINLKNIGPGDYELVALPLRIEGSDGSPVRAVLIDRAKETNG